MATVDIPSQQKYETNPPRSRYVPHGVQRRIRPRNSALSPWPLEAEVFAHQLSQRDGENHGKTMGKWWFSCDLMGVALW